MPHRGLRVYEREFHKSLLNVIGWCKCLYTEFRELLRHSNPRLRHLYSEPSRRPKSHLPLFIGLCLYKLFRSFRPYHHRHRRPLLPWYWLPLWIPHFGELPLILWREYRLGRELLLSKRHRSYLLDCFISASYPTFLFALPLYSLVRLQCGPSLRGRLF